MLSVNLLTGDNTLEVKVFLIHWSYEFYYIKSKLNGNLFFSVLEELESKGCVKALKFLSEDGWSSSIAMPEYFHLDDITDCSYISLI